jgi:hypothetical protein
MHYGMTGAPAWTPGANKDALRGLAPPGGLGDSAVIPGLIGYLNGTPAGWISLDPRPEYLRLR